MYTRESLAVVPGFSLTGEHVVAYLERIRRQRGAPRSIQVDNGSEFYGKAMDAWPTATEFSWNSSGQGALRTTST